MPNANPQSPSISTLPSQRLAALVRTERKKMNLTQVAFAERAGIHRNFVSLIERGVSQPTIDYFFAIATALGLSGEELAAKIAPPRA